MSSWGQLLLGGFVAGCAYLLIGLSWNVVYNACGYLNLAVGQFYVLAAILAVELAQRLPGWPRGVTLVLTIVLVTSLGWASERALLRPLSGGGLAPLMVTVGIALGLAQAARWLAPTLVVRPEDWLRGDPLEVAGVFVVRQDLVVIAVTAGATAVLAAVSRWSDAGRAMRACADDRETARMLGIDVRRISTVAFGVGAGLAALAGVTVTPVTGVAAGSGELTAITAFLAVSLGGIGRYGRGAVCAILVGVSEAVLARYLGAEARNVIVLSAFVLLLALDATASDTGHTSAQARAS